MVTSMPVQGEKAGGWLCCRARLAIQEAFGPSVKVVSVPAREILLGGGDIHCMSMQVRCCLQTYVDARWTCMPRALNN
jgi:hypothetical protein